MGRCKGRLGVCCSTPTWNTYQKDGCAHPPLLLMVGCWYHAGGMGRGSGLFGEGIKWKTPKGSSIKGAKTLEAILKINN